MEGTMPYESIAALAPRERGMPPLGDPLPAGTIVVSPDSHHLESSTIVDRLPPKYRDRMYNVALVNFWDPGATRDEIQAVKALGMRALSIPIAPIGLEYNDPAMEPMWDAFEEGGIPVSFHVGEGLVYNYPGAMAMR